MNRWIEICFVFLGSFLWSVNGFAEDTKEQNEALHIKASLVLKVEKKEKAAKTLIAEAKKSGGYYFGRNDSALHMKIPTNKVESYMTFAEKQGLVAGRSFASNSLSQNIANAAARLKAREELLEKYFQILQSARSGAIVTVEQEVIRLVSEIENFKGKLRHLTHKATYSDVHISFQFRDRRAPSRSGSSPFAWINHLNLSDIIREFESGRRFHHSYRTRAKAPKGFAPYKSFFAKDFRAASHDNVLYRVRRVKHKPKANIDFWAEAVMNRMKDAGYLPYGKEKKLQAQKIGKNGRILKLSAPYGNDDFAYWVAFQVEGGKIKIIEAAGELGRFDKSYAKNVEKQITEELK